MDTAPNILAGNKLLFIHAHIIHSSRTFHYIICIGLDIRSSTVMM